MEAPDSEPTETEHPAVIARTDIARTDIARTTMGSSATPYIKCPIFRILFYSLSFTACFLIWSLGERLGMWFGMGVLIFLFSEIGWRLGGWEENDDDYQDPPPTARMTEV